MQLTLNLQRHESPNSDLPLKKRQRRHNRVRFSRAACRWFVKDLTAEEKRNIWYSAEEYKAIQAQVRTDLREAVAVHRRSMKCFELPPPGHEINVRGLEHHLQGPMNMKAQRRRSFVQHVLHTNKYMRVTNPEELRAYALSLSYEDQYRAQRIADYDAYEAYKVHREGRFYGSWEEATEAPLEFNVPKANNLNIGARHRRDRTIVPPLA